MKRLLLLLASVAGAQTPTITPAIPKAVAGGTLQLSSTGTVTWSMAAGSVGSIDGSGLYTAPATVTARQAAKGCQVFPASSIFNTRVDALPVHASSATWIALPASNTKLVIAPNIGSNSITNSTAAYTIHSNYTPSTDGSYRIPSWPDLNMESGVFTNPLGNTDRHIAMVNKDTCEFSEIYNFYPVGTATVLGCPTCTAQSAAKYDGNALGLLTTGATDAAGLPIQPFQLRLQDFLQPGEITHMSRYTMGNHIISPSYVWPATANASAPFGSVPYGSILRLKASVDISGYSAIAQKILTAWKHYGLILSDGGNTIDVSADTDVHLNPAVWSAIEELRFGGPTISNYEYVDQSSLMVSASSAAVKFDNAYQVPNQYAVAVAEDTTSHNTTKAYIALQGVVVGVPHPAEIYQAGGPASQLTWWVTGSGTQTVTWAMSPSVGTLTSGGLYTPPASAASPTTTTFTGTSAADSSAKIYILATILPAGTIRINTGDPTTDVSFSGNTWWREVGWDSAQSIVISDPGSWPGGTNPIYYDYRYTGGDQVYRLNLANGNYKLSIYNGIMHTAGSLPVGDFVSTYDAQGQVVYHELDLSTKQATYNTAATPIDMPLWVQDGTAYFSVRQLTDNTYSGAPVRHCTISGSPIICPPQTSAFTIAADATPAYLAIDGSTASITISQTRQFYAVGWYMSNAVTWSVATGPGTIDSNGLYTAPSTPPGSDTAVVVRATSSVDGVTVANISFTFTFGTMVATPTTATLSHGLTRQFAVTIGGVAYTNVTWSVTPAVGSISSGGLYTAPYSIAVDTAVIVKATSADDVTKSVSVPFTVLAVMPTIFVNNGFVTSEGDFVDGLGNQWVHDYGYHGTTQTYSTTANITGTSNGQLPLYQSHRYAYQTESFYYLFDVPIGNYAVKLYWADFDFPSSGHYVMDVDINSVRVKTAFDPDVAAGGTYAAYSESFNTTSNTAALRIDFAGNGASGWPSISGIQITETPTPRLAITKTHIGNFYRGQIWARYTITVQNPGTGPTSGTVTVADTLPSGLTLATMYGTGWSCISTTCTRSDALVAGGGSYPPILILANVASNAPTSVVNSVAVSGGGSASASATDTTSVRVLPPPPPAGCPQMFCGEIGIVGAMTIR